MNKIRSEQEAGDLIDMEVAAIMDLLPTGVSVGLDPILRQAVRVGALGGISSGLRIAALSDASHRAIVMPLILAVLKALGQKGVTH